MAGQVVELIQWQYVAHVLKNDGRVVELKGTTQAWAQSSVYHELAGKAKELGGMLTGCHIVELDDDCDIPWTTDDTPDTRHAEEVTPRTWGSADAFGTWNSTYYGASLCTYKVEDEEKSSVF